MDQRLDLMAYIIEDDGTMRTASGLYLCGVLVDVFGDPVADESQGQPCEIKRGHDGRHGWDQR